MAPFTYREAKESDIPGMARIRAVEWETEEYWLKRISAYLQGKLNPQNALKPHTSQCVTPAMGNWNGSTWFQSGGEA